MNVIGIDPGRGGAIAQLYGDKLVTVWDMPVVAKTYDAAAIAELLRGFDLVAVEDAKPHPRDGKVGWRSMGEAVGVIRGVVGALGIRSVWVSPARWKREFGLIGKDDPKEAARQLALEMFPQLSAALKRKKDHGRAEALLIAEWARRREVASGGVEAKA